jgi:hypothetical protein
LDIGSELLDVCFVFFYRTIKKCLAKPIQSNEETRHKILKIAKQLNYRPNRIARSLVNHKSNLISLIVADISNPFFAELARGIEDKARENGYFVIYCSTDNNQEDLESRVRLMQEVGCLKMLFWRIIFCPIFGPGTIAQNILLWMLFVPLCLVQKLGKENLQI